VPSIKCSYREFIAIIESNGFALHRHGATSHSRYRGVINGVVHFVDVSGHGNQEIAPGTLSSMIRQSGLPKGLFRK
jgi:predicted RNA binding protein YcfA (HicA-like mRNA interferase family)